MQFVYLENNQYVLKIKPEKLKELNISERFYQMAIAGINETNKLIQSTMVKGESLYLTNPQSKEVTLMLSSSRSNSQYGDISTVGNEFGQDAFYPAYGKNYVRFFCRTNVAMLPVYVCKTEAWNTWKSVTAVGALGRTTEIDVPIVVSGSNVCVNLYFVTSDSNGGSAYWKAINTGLGE